MTFLAHRTALCVEFLNVSFIHQDHYTKYLLDLQTYIKHREFQLWMQHQAFPELLHDMYASESIHCDATKPHPL